MCTVEDFRRLVRPTARGRIISRENPRRSTVRAMSAISQVFPLNSVRPTNVGTTTCPTKKDVGEAIRNNKFSGLQVAHGNINHLPNADQQVKSKIFQVLNLPLNAIRIQCEDNHMVSRKRRLVIASQLSFHTRSMGNISLIRKLDAQALSLKNLRADIIRRGKK